ncbi:ABC transporter substrate-binding protein [Nocardia sp. NPDC005366]|uniref:ABC transporter substrate-binding protein n=1 Tax=Nocardia sp. NPDC005366 TaxID=3156878 RepID=UPI0033A3B3AE
MKRGFLNARRAGIGVAVAALALASTVACGDDADTSSGAGTADPAVLGPVNAATGDLVTIGFIGEGKSAAIDTSAEFTAAQAAVDYINEHLGGLRGHRIQLKTCETKSSPAGATDCANQMISAGAVAVVEGALGNVDQTIDVLSPAGVPLVLNYATSQSSLSVPNVFTLMNGVSAIFGTPAALAEEQKVTKAAMVTIDVPAATGAANQLGKLAFGNAGVGLDVVTIPPGTPDVTSQITAANRNDPGLWTVLGNTNFCGGVLKAIKTVDRGATIVVNDRCVDTTISSSIPGGFEGIQVGTTANLDPTTEDVKLFQAAVDKYKPGLRIEANSAGGWQPVLGLARAMNAVAGQEVTRQSVPEALRSAPAQPYPLTNGIQFQCNGQAFPLSRNVCASDVIVATADKGGVLGGYRILRTDASLFTPPAR